MLKHITLILTKAHFSKYAKVMCFSKYAKVMCFSKYTKVITLVYLLR